MHIFEPVLRAQIPLDRPFLCLWIMWINKVRNINISNKGNGKVKVLLLL